MADPEETIRELKSALGATLEYIDAIPKDVVASLPPMPGFDRDWVNDLLEGTPPEPKGR